MKKLVNYRPILFFAIALVLGGYLFVGAIAHEYLYIVIGSLLFLTLILSVIYLIKSKNSKVIIRILACGILPFLVGGIITSSVATKKCNIFKDFGTYEITATVCSGGVLDGSGSAVVKDVELRDINNSGKVVRLDGEYKIKKIVSDEATQVYVGDKIRFVGEYDYCYQEWLEQSPLNASATNGNIIIQSDYEVVESGKGVKYSILKWARNTIYNNLDKKEADIAYSMLFGDKTFMDGHLKSMYGISGVSHILAVSGLHVGFMISILGWLFSKIIKNKWAYLITMLSILIGYAYICNWAPSVIRAVSMFGVSGIALRTFRQYDGLNSLAVASLINFICVPLDIFNVGFLLSYAVVFSIFAISPRISQLLDKKMPKKVASGLSLSVSAWLGSIPITIFYFDYTSVFACLLNLIVIPFVGVLFIVIVLCLCLSVVPAFASFFMAIPGLLIKCLNFLVEGVGSLSTSSIDISLGYPILIFGMFAIIMAGDYVFIKRKSMLTAVLMFGFVGFMTIYNL